MTKLLAFAIIATLLFLLSCSDTNLNSIEQDRDNLTVKMEIKYDSPNLPNTEVSIENGTLTIKHYIGNSTKTLSAQDFEHFQKTIRENEFFSLSELEGAPCSYCIPFSITVSRSNESHTVTCQNYDLCSVQFNNIKREIVLLWDFGTFDWPLPQPTVNLSRIYHPSEGRLLRDSIPGDKEIIQRMNVRLECKDNSRAQRIDVVEQDFCVDCYQEWVIDCANDNQFLVVVSEESSRGGFFLFEGRPFQ